MLQYFDFSLFPFFHYIDQSKIKQEETRQRRLHDKLYLKNFTFISQQDYIKNKILSNQREISEII